MFLYNYYDTLIVAVDYLNNVLPVKTFIERIIRCTTSKFYYKSLNYLFFRFIHGDALYTIIAIMTKVLSGLSFKYSKLQKHYKVVLIKLITNLYWID